MFQELESENLIFFFFLIIKIVGDSFSVDQLISSTRNIFLKIDERIYLICWCWSLMSDGVSLIKFRLILSDN